MKLTNTQQQVLKFLLSAPEERFSIRQTARILEKSYTLMYHNLQKLHQAGIIEKKPVPPAQLISLSPTTPVNVLIDMERQRTADFLEKHPWMDLYVKDVLKAAPPFFIMILFGSYAKGTQTLKSDVDIIIITPTQGDIKALDIAVQQYTKAKKSLLIVAMADFMEMIKNPTVLNVGNEAKKHHLILYGAEQYYQLLQKAYTYAEKYSTSREARETFTYKTTPVIEARHAEQAIKTAEEFINTIRQLIHKK